MEPERPTEFNIQPNNIKVANQYGLNLRLFMGMQNIGAGSKDASSLMGFLDIASGDFQRLWYSVESLIGKFQRDHTKKLVNINLELEKICLPFWNPDQMTRGG